MTLALVDGSNLIHKIYHALLDRKTKRLNGDPMPVMKVQLDALDSRFRELEIALDHPADSWRAELCPEYKSGRNNKTPELLDWIERATDLLLSQWNAVRVPGAEADDIIATMAHEQSLVGKCVIVSADKDLYQCIRPGCVVILRSFKTYRRQLQHEEWMNLEIFEDKFTLSPPQWPHYRALVGDSSDCMSGVVGCGPDATTKLLQRYNVIEEAIEGIKRLETTGVKRSIEAKIVAAWECGDLQKWIRIHTLSKRVALPVRA